MMTVYQMFIYYITISEKTVLDPAVLVYTYILSNVIDSGAARAYFGLGELQ